MWLQRLHRHGDNSVNATCFSCNSLWWQCRGWCHDSIVLIFVLFLIRTAQNYLCPQSSVEDDAKEKGAMADHSFQASDVLHLEKKVWINLNKKVWSKELYILSFLCFENKARVIRFDVSNATKSNRNAKASHKQSVFLSETLSVRLYRFFIGFKHSHSSLNESFLEQTTFWVQSYKPYIDVLTIWKRKTLFFMRRKNIWTSSGFDLNENYVPMLACLLPSQRACRCFSCSLELCAKC